LGKTPVRIPRRPPKIPQELAPKSKPCLCVGGTVIIQPNLWLGRFT